MNTSIAAAAPTASGSILSTFFALALVVAMILALAWVLRRVQGGALRNAGPIRVVAAVSVGMKERVVLVEVAGEQLLLGVTAARIELLQRLDTPIEPVKQSTPFLQMLMRQGGIGRA
jgi:flagellar protein FliO/FliZ